MLPPQVWYFLGGIAVGILIGLFSSSMIHRKRRPRGGAVGGDDQATFRRVFGPHP